MPDQEPDHSTPASAEVNGKLVRKKIKKTLTLWGNAL
jgi:hypothetical protein